MVDSRDKPALVLSIESGFINLNQRIVHKIDKIPYNYWVVNPIIGKSHNKMQTITAAMPNHKAAKLAKLTLKE